MLMHEASTRAKTGNCKSFIMFLTLALFSCLSSVQYQNMTEAHSLYETASRIALAADCKEELQTAAGLMRQAADLGHGAAAGAFGNMLMAGRGVEQNTDLAYRYWSDAVLEGSDSDSAIRLGLACRDGGAHLPDLAGALAWFMIARDLGSYVVLPDIDDVQFELDEATRSDAFMRYAHIRANCDKLR